MSFPDATMRLSNQWMTATSNTCTVTITFEGQRVTGMKESNFRMDDENASISNVGTTDGGLTWHATLTANENTEAVNHGGWGSTFTLVYRGLTAADGSPGASGGKTSDQFYMDTLRPTLDSIKVDYRPDGTGVVTFKFSETVSGFGREDVTVQEGRGRLTSDPVSSDNGLTWTANITSPVDQINNDKIFSVDLTGVRDTKLGGSSNAGLGHSDGGNNYSVSNSRPALVAIDAIKVTYANGASALGAGATATVTIKFTEAVTSASFTLENRALTVPTGRGTLSDLHSTDGGTTWLATLTGPTQAGINDANNTITVDLASVRDSAGNTGSNSDPRTANYAIDTVRPGASMVLSKNLLATAGASAETATLTITFDEPVAGTLSATDNFTVSNGALSNLHATGTDGKTWTATLTPAAGSNAANASISLNITGMHDLAGNPGSADPVTTTFSTDATRPTLAAIDGIKLDKSTFKANDSTRITFNFSEAVTGLTGTDVNLPAGCSLSDLKAVDGSGAAITGDNPASTRWTATLHTGTQSPANAAISVNLAGVNDRAGNAGTDTSAATSITIDGTAPTATIVVGEGTRTSAGVTTHQVTVTFSEPVSGSATNKLTADNGTLSNLQALDANGNLITSANQASTASTRWRATLTTTEGVDDASNVVHLNTTGLADAAGNGFANSEVTSNNYVVDNRGPVLSTATVNGNQLVLTFDDASNLDAAHGPALAAFEVKADGVAVSVLRAVVNAGAKTVTLTLGSAVTCGQSVTVRYTDPGTGDDSNAIQDTFGHDAASIPAAQGAGTPGQPVDNGTPDPQAPAPSAQDRDKDGVPDSVENQAPGIRGPNGADAVTGDANGDGVQDSQQATVASASFGRGPRGSSDSDDLPKTPVTLTISGQDGKPATDPGGASILNLTQKDTATGLPANMEQPIGLTQFQAKVGATGASQTFSLYVDAGLGVNGFWVKDGTGTWTNLASEAQGGKMVTEDGRLRLDFHLTDGGQYDSDGLADGTISATGAAAQMPLSLTGQAPDTAEDGLFWF